MKNYEEPSAPLAFVSLLNANKRLKRLDIGGNFLFGDDLLSTISCKLRVIFLSFCGSTPDEKKNCNLFLLSQRETVEVLVIRSWMGIEVMQTISMMPRLKTLLLHDGYTNPLEFAAVVFPQNHSVTNLNVLQGDRYNFDWYKRLIEAYPNIGLLKVSVLTDEMAEFVPEMCKNLKELYVNKFQAENVQERNEAFYLNLKTFKCLKIDPFASNELLERLNGTLVASY